MSENLSIRPSLLIVSDTAIWQENQSYLPYEPVVRELESIETLFSNVTWIGYDYGSMKKAESARSTNFPVNYILLKRVGGDTSWSKIEILFQLPFFWYKIVRAINQHDVIHSRGPSVPALIAILISFNKPKKIFWHKYAGNWIEENSPMMYAWQRKLLVKAHRSVVTINGDYKNPPHVLNFMNPCVDENEIVAAEKFIHNRKYDSGVRICFVGNLTRFKGVELLLEAMNLLSDAHLIEELVIVGDGELREELESKAKSLPVRVVFKGYLKRDRLDEVYASCHLNVLPSASEGFPKVIAEGGIFGCCPVVSRISCIDQIIVDKKNGLLLSEITAKGVAASIQFYLSCSQEQKFILAKNAAQVSHGFSYEVFRKRINDEIVVREPFSVMNLKSKGHG